MFLVYPPIAVGLVSNEAEKSSDITSVFLTTRIWNDFCSLTGFHQSLSFGAQYFYGNFKIHFFLRSNLFVSSFVPCLFRELQNEVLYILNTYV